MAKKEVYASKSAMAKHEKGEGPKMKAAEKKAGTKNSVKKCPMCGK